MEKALFILKENIRLLLGLAVVLFAIVLLIVFVINKSASLTKTKISIHDKTFNVYIAKTDYEKQVGLSVKNKISENEGMLFVFDKPDYYSFWMKEMKFPIDIIYMENDKVVSIVRNAQPPSGSENLKIYQPKEKSNMVLELNAGLAEKYNIKEGTSVKVENL